jgi:peptidoglycan-associated lipoprotein
MKHVALSLAVAALVAAGCASKDEKPAEVSQATVPSSTGPKPGSGTTAGTGTAKPPTGTAMEDHRNPNSPLAKRSVFFDFDSNVVKDEYQGTVQAHSRYLGDKRDMRIRIEGNTDERGSREYNLALGQRRAEAVKKVMTVLGVQDGRIETISYGEEKPRSPGHDEQAWAQNRRADIKYPGE